MLQYDWSFCSRLILLLGSNYLQSCNELLLCGPTPVKHVNTARKQNMSSVSDETVVV